VSEPLFGLSPEHLRETLAEVQRQAVQDVGTAAAAYKGAGTALDQAVNAARAAGATWTDIGRAVGIARQTARERWSR
jgi:hypothetical protein